MSEFVVTVVLSEATNGDDAQVHAVIYSSEGYLFAPGRNVDNFGSAIDEYVSEYLEEFGEVFLYKRDVFTNNAITVYEYAYSR